MRPIALLALLALTGCADARPVYEQVHGATLRLEVKGGSCSGTAVGRNTVLTASHCFEDGKPATIKANGELCEVRALIHDGNDHVLVLLSGCPFKQTARMGEPARVGDRVFLWGSPLFLIDQLRFGTLSGYGYFPKAVQGAEPNGLLAKQFQFFDLGSTYGDSGGAVFNMQGQIVAVVSVGTDPITTPFHLMGAVAIRFTRKQLKDAGL